ncbi:hypothetical protein H4R24_001453 [Coemansia sp. RSA 988]|nr:hypothetical protein H4R24_001453 [Coemansia sp. RSA 988]
MSATAANRSHSAQSPIGSIVTAVSETRGMLRKKAKSDRAIGYGSQQYLPRNQGWL